MKFLHLTLVVSLSCIYCITPTDTERVFYLEGHTHAIPDGTILYLRQNNIVVDSTLIVDDKFVFEGEIDEVAEQFVLVRQDTPVFKYIWLEGGTIFIDATEGEFRESIVTGSDTQLLGDTLANLLKNAGHGLKRRRIEQKFVFDHPESVISAKILAVYATTWGKETTQELFSRLSDELKANKEGQKVKKYLDLVKAPQVGETYADFSMSDTTGRVLKLSNHLSDLTLLEFWASWCGPCRIENPRLVKTYWKHKEDGFNVFAVSLDNNAGSWKKAIITDSLPWPQVSDLNGEQNAAGLIYGVSGIPDNFLIDQQGTIIGRNLRGDDLDQQIESYLAGKPNE